MNNRCLVILIVLGIGFTNITSCSQPSLKDNIPNMQLAMEYGIDTTQLIYQYYQKYGFTDVCEDIRMVSKSSDIPKLEKSLPLESQDISIINSFSNKIDRLEKSAIHFHTNTRNEFYDIELDFLEFKPDTSLAINLSKGSYQVIESDLMAILKVYDSQSELLYVEIHKCDGN